MVTKAPEQPPELLEQLTQGLTTVAQHDIASIRSNAIYWERMGRRFRDDLRRAEGSIEQYKREIAASDEYVEKYKQEANEAEAKFKESGEQDAIREKAALLLKQLQKHALFDSLTVDANGLVHIQTRLLFADIRAGGGESETERTCIGAYRISFIPRSGERFTVTNLLYRGHWSISGGSPCLGEWESGFNTLLNSGDIYGIFDMFTHYLRSAMADYAAYMSSHVWKASYRRVQRAFLSNEENNPPFKVGDYAIFTADEYDGENLEGQVCVIESVSGSGTEGNEYTATCLFREYESSDGDYRDEFRWNVPADMLQHITQAEYNARPRYEIRRKAQRVNVKIDALPDGSRLSDAQKIIKATANDAVKLL